MPTPHARPSTARPGPHPAPVILALVLGWALAMAPPPARAAEQIYYFHNDHLGTPQLMTDAAQNLVWQATPNPFGADTPAVATVDNPLRFPGQYHDPETGLYYNWHRYYNPETGRYLTSDPAGLSDGPNPYTYVYNNPLGFYDPNGEAAQAAAGCLVGAWAGPLGCGAGAAITTLVTIGGLSALIRGDTPSDQCDDNEEECLEEIEGCIARCIRARDNRHRMPGVWGGSWWTCMTGCVSTECLDYLDHSKHGEP